MSQQNRRLEAIAMTALLTLTGCADSAVISTSYLDPSYKPREFTGQGILPVLVSGDPFPVPRDQGQEAEDLYPRKGPAHSAILVPHRVPTGRAGIDAGLGCTLRTTPLGNRKGARRPADRTAERMVAFIARSLIQAQTP
jgi:hypothetical protein